MIDERIKTPNIKENMRRLIEPFLINLKQKEEILAILILGGMSSNNKRHHLDIYSDIDIAIFIEKKENIPDYIPNYEFYLFDKDNRKVEINVHEMIISVEEKIEWDEGKKEAYKHAEYYFEKDDRVRKLINFKIALEEEYRKNRLALIIGQYKWFVEINPLRAIKRGFNINAIELLNKGIELFYEALFLYNREYQPHPKWRFELSCDLSWTPNNYRKKMEKAILTKGTTEKEILKKRKYIITLFEELLTKLDEEFGKGTDYYKYACYKSYTDRQIVEYTYADKLYGKVATYLSDDEKYELYAFINENLIGNDEQLLNVKNIQLNHKYDKILNKVISLLNTEDKNE